MSQERHVLKALILSAIGLLSLMALTTSGAWGQELRILGAKAPASESFNGEAITEYLFRVPPQFVLVHCKVKTIDEAVALPNGWTDENELYTQCQTLQKEVTSPGCKPAEPISMKGNKFLILHSGRNYLLFAPSKNAKGEYNPFGTIKFNEETCALPSENKATGSVVFECLTEGGASGNCNEEIVKRRIRPAPAALFEGDKLSFGINPMTLEGTGSLFLTGGKAGCKWSGVV